MSKKGFSIFIIHPRDVKKLAGHIIYAKDSIITYLKCAGINDYILDIANFNSIPGIGGKYEKGIQEQAINPVIESADLIVIVIGKSEGGDGFKKEIELINKLEKPFICFLPHRKTVGRIFIEEKLSIDRNKDFLNKYKNENDFRANAPGTIGSKLCEMIRQISDSETKKVNKKIIKIPKVNKKFEEEVSESLKNLFISDELKYKYYYPFIDLLEPFYVDMRGEEIRARLRKLFKISIEQEKSFIDRMKKENLIKIAGDVCLIQHRDLSSNLLDEMFNKEAISLENIIKLFI